MPDPQVLHAPGDCTLRAMRTLRDALAATLGSTGALAIDCAAVERADLAFVQLVVSAQRTAEREGRALSLANASEPVRSAFARAGLLPDAPFRAIA